MFKREEFDFFVEEMLNSAVKDFKGTEQYRLLQGKLEQMDRDCDVMLMENEKNFVVECFELLLDIGGQEEYYVYRKGLHDCVGMLKCLGVLA